MVSQNESSFMNYANVFCKQLDAHNGHSKKASPGALYLVFSILFLFISPLLKAEHFVRFTGDYRQNSRCDELGTRLSRHVAAAKSSIVLATHQLTDHDFIRLLMHKAFYELPYKEGFGNEAVSVYLGDADSAAGIAHLINKLARDVVFNFQKINKPSYRQRHTWMQKAQLSNIRFVVAENKSQAFHQKMLLIDQKNLFYTSANFSRSALRLGQLENTFVVLDKPELAHAERQRLFYFYSRHENFLALKLQPSKRNSVFPEVVEIRASFHNRIEKPEVITSISPDTVAFSDPDDQQSPIAYANQEFGDPTEVVFTGFNLSERKIKIIRSRFFKGLGEQFRVINGVGARFLNEIKNQDSSQWMQVGASFYMTDLEPSSPDRIVFPHDFQGLGRDLSMHAKVLLTDTYVIFSSGNYSLNTWDHYIISKDQEIMQKAQDFVELFVPSEIP